MKLFDFACFSQWSCCVLQLYSGWCITHSRSELKWANFEPLHCKSRKPREIQWYICSSIKLSLLPAMLEEDSWYIAWKIDGKLCMWTKRESIRSCSTFAQIVELLSSQWIFWRNFSRTGFLQPCDFKLILYKCLFWATTLLVCLDESVIWMTWKLQGGNRATTPLVTLAGSWILRKLWNDWCRNCQLVYPTNDPTCQIGATAECSTRMKHDQSTESCISQHLTNWVTNCLTLTKSGHQLRCRVCPLKCVAPLGLQMRQSLSGHKWCNLRRGWHGLATNQVAMG